MNRDKTPSPYDLGALGRERFRDKLKKGYVPKDGSPYDLHYVRQVLEYHKMKKNF